MSDDNIINVDFPPKTEERKLYVAILKCMTPSGSMVQVAAHNEDHAKQLITEMAGDVKDLEFLEVFLASEAPELNQELPSEHEGTDTVQ